MKKAIRCPLIPRNIYPQGCTEKNCIYHTILKENGCSHSSPITIQTWARNKGVTQKSVKQAMTKIHNQIQYALQMYAYIQFCPEQFPSEQDLRDYERSKNKLPYRIPSIATIFSAPKMASMKDDKIFEKFCKLQHITLEMPLQQFLFYEDYSKDFS